MTNNLALIDTNDLWKQILTKGTISNLCRVGKNFFPNFYTSKWFYKFYSQDRLYLNCDSQLRRLLLILTKTSKEKALLWKANFDDWFSILTDTEQKKLSLISFVEKFGFLSGEITALVISDKREALKHKLTELLVLIQMMIRSL